MFVGAELAAWLNDPQRQAEAREAADEFTKRWIARPAVRELQHALRSLNPKTADAVLAAALQFMARADDLRDLVRDFNAVAAENPFFRPHFMLLGSDVAISLLLYGDPSVSISLGVTSADALAAKKGGKRGASSIAFSGLQSAFQFLKSGGATLSFWEAPESDGTFADDQGGHCRFVERRRVEDGEVLLLDGRTQSFVIEHASSDMVYLQAEVHVDRAPLAVEYDSRTLALVGASSTDEISSRVQMMVSLLRLMDRKDAAPIVARLIERAPFHTRWYLMRELLALDAEAALPVLGRLAESDPHPEVRATAAQTLKLFFGADEEAA